MVCGRSILVTRKLILVGAQNLLSDPFVPSVKPWTRHLQVPLNRLLEMRVWLKARSSKRPTRPISPLWGSLLRPPKLTPLARTLLKPPRWRVPVCLTVSTVLPRVRLSRFPVACVMLV